MPLPKPFTKWRPIVPTFQKELVTVVISNETETITINESGAGLWHPAAFLQLFQPI